MAKSLVKKKSCPYQKTTLKNGLRVITEKIPSVRSITLGVWADVGSRNETSEENGITHLIEHIVFKGTKKRSAKDIASSLESIGGILNAFTSREQTCYIARILDEHLEEAVDVLSDITCNATLTPVNIQREKKVVCEEIKETKETPAEHIHDIFATTFWGSHPLGQPILGQMDNIIQVPRLKIVNYIKQNYKTASIVIAASGSVSHRKLVDLVKKKFHFPDGIAAKYQKAARTVNRNIIFKSNKNKQVHLCLGYPGIEYASKEKMTALVLSSYLGGGMSSILFQKIREEKGLAYTVYTYLDFYRDAGIFGAYLATDKNNLKQSVKIVLEELQKIKKKRLSKDKLDKVKAQLKGNLTLGMESTSNRMNRLARYELMMGSYYSLKQTLVAIDRVTPADVLQLANRIFDKSQIAISVLGPAEKNVLDNVL